MRYYQLIISNLLKIDFFILKFSFIKQYYNNIHNLNVYKNFKTETS